MSDQKKTGLSRRQALAGLGVTATGLIASPSIILAQTPDAIRFGHLTPRTGFLGPLGEYGVMAADLAAEEINAAGGINGRKLELLKEDSVNPQTASTTKAYRSSLIICSQCVPTSRRSLFVPLSVSTRKMRLQCWPAQTRSKIMPMPLPPSITTSSAVWRLPPATRFTA